MPLLHPKNLQYHIGEYLKSNAKTETLKEAMIKQLHWQFADAVFGRKEEIPKVAKRLKMTPAHFVRILNGTRNLTPEMAEKLSAVL